MKDKKLRIGLIGRDVSKSTSPQIHRFILQRLGYACEYEKISVQGEDFDEAMRRLLGDFDGFNVTIPYKRDVMEYLDEVVGDAFDFGAVNTVVTATRSGHNTDGVGFLQMLRAANIEVNHKKILVLGGGGAGRSTAAALKKAGAEVYMYQRNQAHLQETCGELAITPLSNPLTGGFDILVNATGVGMHESEGISPVLEEAFVGASAAIDLIYYPPESAFLKMAKGLGLQIVNGAAMLFYQAYYADCLFLGVTPDEGQANALYHDYQKTEEGL